MISITCHKIFSKDLSSAAMEASVDGNRGLRDIGDQESLTWRFYGPPLSAGMLAANPVPLAGGFDGRRSPTPGARIAHFTVYHQRRRYSDVRRVAEHRADGRRDGYTHQRKHGHRNGISRSTLTFTSPTSWNQNDDRQTVTVTAVENDIDDRGFVDAQRTPDGFGRVTITHAATGRQLRWRGRPRRVHHHAHQ